MDVRCYTIMTMRIINVLGGTKVGGAIWNICYREVDGIKIVFLQGSPPPMACICPIVPSSKLLWDTWKENSCV
jgi:hypothetical protein